MTLKEIMTDVLALLDIRDITLTDDAVAGDRRLSTIVDCVNFALEEIASSYAPLIACETVSFRGGAAPYSDLREMVYKVMSVVIDGESIDFVKDVSGIKANADKAQVYYRYLPRRIGKLSDRAPVATGLPRIAVAYAACAEYALVRGEFEQRVAFEDKFNDYMKEFERPAKRVIIKKRAWR